MSIVQNQIRTGYIMLATISDTEPVIYNEQQEPQFSLGDSYYNSTTHLIYTVIQDSDTSLLYWGEGSAPIAGHIYLNKAIGIFYGVNNGELFANIGTVDLTNPMTVALDMGSHKITGLSDGLNSGDAINKSQLDTKANISDVILNTEKGAANGVPELDSNGIIPDTQLPTATTQNVGVVQPDGVSVTIDEDGVLSAVQASSYKPPLLQFIWSDHLINQVSWLRANTFSWQDGSVYSAAYTHLANEITPINTDLVYNSLTSSIIDQRSFYRTSRIAYRNSTYDYTENGTTFYAWAYGDTLNTFSILVDGWFTLSETPQANDTVYVADLEDLTDGVQATSYTLGVSNQIFCDNIDNVHFPVYYKADDGHKICLDDSYVSGVYMYLMPDNPIAWYFVLDTVNQRFKLPYVTGHNRILIKELHGSDNRWARVYNDGWVEQGGIAVNATGNVVDLTAFLLVEFNDINYILLGTQERASSSGDSYPRILEKTTTTVKFQADTQSKINWEAKGYSDSAYTLLLGVDTQYKSEQKYLYFYVGNFAETAIAQTAGLNSELFNDKADISDLQTKANTDLSNVLVNIDYIVDSQLPTAENNYTWYRKYKSGWLEQGGNITYSGTSNSEQQITFVKAFADTNYTFLTTIKYNGDAAGAYMTESITTPRTTTTINLIRTIARNWQACGQGA